MERRPIASEIEGLFTQPRPGADAGGEGILIIIKENLRGLGMGLKGTEGVTMDSHTPSLIKA